MNALGGADPDAPGERPAAEAGTREAPVSYEQSQQRVHDAFAAEAVDASWGRDATRQLDEIVRAHLPVGSRLLAVECHTTMCEVRVTHADPNALGDWLMKGFHGWPGPLFVASTGADRGELAVTVIASREGTEPPIAP